MTFLGPIRETWLQGQLPSGNLETGESRGPQPLLTQTGSFWSHEQGVPFNYNFHELLRDGCGIVRGHRLGSEGPHFPGHASK